VREPRPIPGAVAPLFDRLTNGGPGQQAGAAAPPILDAVALRDHVRDDLSRLLNTRSAFRGRTGDVAEETVLNYGLPDFSALTAASETDRTALAELIARQIRKHEPRLAAVQVILREIPHNPMAVSGVVVATLCHGPVSEPVTFRLAMDTRHPENPIAVT
jgi:type VI secretion system lysozyme-like protein